MDWLTELTHLIESLSPLAQALAVLIPIVIGLATTLAARFAGSHLSKHRAQRILQTKNASSDTSTTPPSVATNKTRNQRQRVPASNMQSRTNTVSPTISPTISPIFNIHVNPVAAGTSVSASDAHGQVPAGDETSQPMPINSVADIIPPTNEAMSSSNMQLPSLDALSYPHVSALTFQAPSRSHTDRPHLAPNKPAEAVAAIAHDSEKNQETLGSEIDIRGETDGSAEDQVGQSVSIEQQAQPLWPQHTQAATDNASARLTSTSPNVVWSDIGLNSVRLPIVGAISPAIDEASVNTHPAQLTESAPPSQVQAEEAQIADSLEVSTPNAPSTVGTGQASEQPQLLNASHSSQMDSAISSGKLALPSLVRQGREERSNLRLSVKYASLIVQEARSSLSRYQKTSASERPFQNEVRILGILYEYLRDTRDLVGPFNSAMNKLNIEWIGGDPREILLSYPDPLSPYLSSSSASWTPSDLRRTLTEVMRDMVDTAKSVGYEPQRRQYAKNGFPNRTWVYVLPRTRDDLLDTYEAPEDADGETVGEQMSEENFNEEPDSLSSM